MTLFPSGFRLQNLSTFSLVSEGIALALLGMATSANGDQASVLDISAHPTAQKLSARCAEFFAEVQDL